MGKISKLNVKGSWSGWHEEKFLESCENPKSVYCLSDYIFYQEPLIKDDMHIWYFKGGDS